MGQAHLSYSCRGPVRYYHPSLGTANLRPDSHYWAQKQKGLRSQVFQEIYLRFLLYDNRKSGSAATVPGEALHLRHWEGSTTFSFIWVYWDITHQPAKNIKTPCMLLLQKLITVILIQLITIFKFPTTLDIHSHSSQSKLPGDVRSLEPYLAAGVNRLTLVLCKSSYCSQLQKRGWVTGWIPQSCHPIISWPVVTFSLVVKAVFTNASHCQARWYTPLILILRR